MYAVHTYEPGDTGRCTSGWYNDTGKWIACGSSQRSSTLHDDPEAEFREMHWHDGRDCLDFEDPDGPTYSEALAAFVAGR